MSVVIKISGNTIERLKGSLRVSDAIEQRSTASFVVVDRTGIADYVKGQAVLITIDGNTAFAGFIERIKQKRVAPQSDIIYWTVQCIDNHYLADKRLAAEVYTGKTAKFIVEDLITKYLTVEGVAVGEVQTGPTFEETIINYQSLSRVFDVLAEKSGFIWYIDKIKELYFIERTTNSAPFDVDAGDIIKERGMLSELTEANPSYRNTQYLRGGKALTALQTETFTTQDATVKSFVVGYPLAKVPTSIKEDAGPALSLGIKGIDTGKDYYWNKGEASIVAEVAPGAGVVVEIKYYGEYSIFVLSEDTDAIDGLKAIEGGTGKVETMADDPASITRNDALASAVAKLDKYGITGQQFRFSVRVWGLQPGQMVTVDYPEYGLNDDDLLIETVDITELAPNELRYKIKAIAGPELGDWTNFFKKLSEQEGNIIERLTIGEDRIIHILKQQKEALALAEATAYHTDAFPPDVSRWIALYPAQGASHHVRHEALALAEAPASDTHATEDYDWDAADAIWDFSTYA